MQLDQQVEGGRLLDGVLFLDWSSLAPLRQTQQRHRQGTDPTEPPRLFHNLRSNLVVRRSRPVRMSGEVADRRNDVSDVHDGGAGGANIGDDGQLWRVAG